MKNRKATAAVMLAGMLATSAGGYAIASAQRPPAARYQLQSDTRGMPGTLVLRNCGPTEDSYREPLHTVAYDGPTDGSRLVLRCQTP